MDNELLGQFRNSVMNLSGSSPDSEWDRAKELFDRLYAARRGKLEVDRGLPSEPYSKPVENRLEVLREKRTTLLERAQAEDGLLNEI